MKNPLPLTDRITCRKSDAMAATSLSLATVNRLIAAGELETVKVRGSRLILVASLLRLLEARPAAPPKRAAAPRAEA